MDIEIAKKEFENYVGRYDKDNKKISGKISHSFRVMEQAKNVAKSIGLSKEEIDVATLIGLLHDIGRFEQLRIYDTFNDSISIDHGNLGVEILSKDNYIREYIKEDKWDNVILKAIKNHNKYSIEEGLNEKELLFTKIIRDADKMDIFYEGAEMFWETEDEIRAIEEATITDKIFDNFKNRKLGNRADRITEADSLVDFVCFIFDINFKYDYIILKKEGYIDKILSKLDFKDEKTKEQFEYIRKGVNEYIEMKGNETF